MFREMGPCALFVVGPAGTGKTTFCATLLEHYASMQRPAHYVNLDPAVLESAVTETGHLPVIDIRERYPLHDIMRTYDLGPNGGLLYALEKLAADTELEDSLRGYGTDDFLVVDCPGQMETFLHEKTMPEIVSCFKRNDYNVAAVFLLDATFCGRADEIEDEMGIKGNKLVAGMLSSLAAMLQLNMPSITVMTKMDLVGGVTSWDPESMEKCFETNPYVDPQDDYLDMVKNILSRYGMTRIVPLDVTDTESVLAIATQIDFLQNDDGTENLQP